MGRYRQSVQPFRYNAAVFPPYGDTKHHWYISTCFPYKHVSLITDSKEEIGNDINNTFGFILHFVPLPYMTLYDKSTYDFNSISLKLIIELKGMD